MDNLSVNIVPIEEGNVRLEISSNNTTGIDIEYYYQKLKSISSVPILEACGSLWNLSNTIDSTDDDFLIKNCEEANNLCLLLSRMKRQILDNSEWLKVKYRIEKVMKTYYYAQHILYAKSQFEKSLKSLEDEEDDIEKDDSPSPCLGMAHFVSLSEDPKSTTGYQKLLLYLMYQAYHRQLRKCNEFCYRRIVTSEGYDTHAWEQCFATRDFIYDVTNKEYNFDMWNHLTRTKGNLESAIQYLSTCRDPQFPHLVKNRHLLSFRNGIYQTKYTRIDNGKWTGRFVSYESGVRLPDHWVASKYFDIDFDDYKDECDWYNIPTPALQQIMDSQEFSEETCRWLYVFIGRLMYELNDLDKWEVIPFLEGQAATGKSTILMHVCKNMFEKGDVGVLSNNIEKKFGLSAFVDKYLFIAPEVRNDLGLDQAEFQSMVSGEEMSVPKKFSVAEQVQWTVPGILAGNQVPNWSDSQSSIARRLVVFEFVKKPDNPDTTLGKRLKNEMSFIIQKCNRAYLDAVFAVGTSSVDSHLPSYFKKTKRMLIEEVDSIRNLLASSLMRIGDEYYMKFEDFKKIYNRHCKENGFKPERINKQSYNGPFFDYGISVITDSREWPRNSGFNINTRWVTGIEENKTSFDFDYNE
jgi:phage/plasmid-associated DNA primase